MSSIIPEGMSGSEWMDCLHKITGIMPTDRKIDLPDRTERVVQGKNFLNSIQAFYKMPEESYKAKVQAFISSSDLPEPVTDNFDMFNDTTNSDMGWMESFKDVSNRIENGKWEVATSSDGTVWKLVPEGHSVEIETKAATLETVRVSKFGAGLGWTDEMIRFREIGRMIDKAEDFRRQYWVDKGDRHYSLLTGASGTTLASGTGSVDGWIDDINTACFTLLDGVKDTLNLPVGHQILLYANPIARPKINRALGELSQAFAGSVPQRVEYNCRPIYTFNSNLPAAASGDSDAVLAVIPGYRIQMGEAMPVTFYEDTDIMSLTFINTAFTYYGAACLDSGTQILTFGLQDA